MLLVDDHISPVVLNNMNCVSVSSSVGDHTLDKLGGYKRDRAGFFTTSIALMLTVDLVPATASVESDLQAEGCSNSLRLLALSECCTCLLNRCVGVSPVGDALGLLLGCIFTLEHETEP